MLLVSTKVFKELSKNIYKFRDKSYDLSSDDGSQSNYRVQELSMTAIRENKQISPVAVSFSLFDRRYVLYPDGHISEDVLSLSAFRNIDGKDADDFNEEGPDSDLSENNVDGNSSIYFINNDEILVKTISSFLEWRLEILVSTRS